MRRLAILWLVSCAGVLAGSFPLSATGCDLSEPETGTVAAIIDGETLKLADGRIVRLIGAKAPMPPLGFRGEDPWPLVEEAKEALSRLAAGKEVELRYGGTRTDRHGYALAQVFVVDGASRLWLQQEMVGQGSPASIPFPTTAPAWEICWRARVMRGGKGSAYGDRPSIASRAPTMSTVSGG